MAYPEQRTTSLRGCLIVIFAIIVGTFACTVITYVTVDVRCGQHADPWIVDYPGSELVQQTHSFIRPWGIGRTTRIIRSDDETNVVRAWYRERNLRLSDEGRRTQGVGSIRLPNVSAGPDGEGSIITMGLSCAPDLDLTP